jgi:hypothetical protein
MSHPCLETKEFLRLFDSQILKVLPPKILSFFVAVRIILLEIQLMWTLLQVPGAREHCLTHCGLLVPTEVENTLLLYSWLMRKTFSALKDVGCSSFHVSLISLKNS